MAQALIINDEVRKDLQSLRKYAEENYITEDVLVKIADKEVAPVGDNPNYVRKVPHGYRVVYSVDRFPDGWYRRISVSVKGGPDRLPSVQATAEIMKMLDHDMSKAEHIGIQEIEDEDGDVLIRAVMIAFKVEKDQA